MYMKYLPKLEAVYQRIGWSIKFNPELVHLSENAKSITLVLEDLKRRHFSIIDMRKGLDFLHMNAVLRKLAEFHAASAVYLTQSDNLQTFYEMFSDGIICDENYDAIYAIQSMCREMFLKTMPLWNLSAPDTNKYTQALPSAVDYCHENRFTCQIKDNDFNVLNHGDCRSNNVMFHYTPEGQIEETIFIDFQMSKWGSPSQDLWYLIVTSAALDIQTREFDHFIQIYHERLLECLKALKYGKRLPTLRDCHSMMIRDAFWGV